jgi:hypothetical protein
MTPTHRGMAQPIAKAQVASLVPDVLVSGEDHDADVAQRICDIPGAECSSPRRSRHETRRRRVGSIGNDEVPTLPGGCIIIDIQLDRAVVVVPLRVLAAADSRYVSTDTISNVLRTYRKHLDLSPEEGAIVERLSNDLFEAMESDARTLLEHVSWAIG